MIVGDGSANCILPYTETVASPRLNPMTLRDQRFPPTPPNFPLESML